MFKKVLLGTGLAVLGVATLASCNKDESGANGAVKVLQIVEGTSTAGVTWDAATAKEAVAQVLTTKGDEVDIILSNNDGMALGIMADATYKKADLPLFGVDALADAIQAIKGGTLDGTIKNDSYSQAKVVIQAALNLINNKEITDGMTAETMPGIYETNGKVTLEEGTKALRVHHQMVTKANVDKLVTPSPVTENDLGDVNSENKFFALTYNNSDPNMSGLWKPGFNDFGKKLGAHVKWTDGAGDDAKALEAVRQAASDSSYDAFLINPVDNTNVKAYIDAVKSTGKPVIIWNREGSTAHMASYDKAYYVGIESAEGGRLQGTMAGEFVLANGGIEKFDRNKDGVLGVIVVRGEKGHPDAEARTENAPKYLEKALAAAKK